MAGGSHFLQRVFQHVVNELLVQRLANSPTFQRFAVRSSKMVEELAEKASEKQKEIAEQVKEASKNVLKNSDAGKSKNF